MTFPVLVSGELVRSACVLTQSDEPVSALVADDAGGVDVQDAVEAEAARVILDRFTGDGQPAAALETLAVLGTQLLSWLGIIRASVGYAAHQDPYY